MANRVWKGVYPKGFESSRHLLLNKFFDQSIPSVRNVDDGEKKDKQDKKRLVKIEVHLRRCQNSFERKGMQKVGFKRMELWG